MQRQPEAPRIGRVTRVMRSLLDVMRSEAGTLEMHVAPQRPADLISAAIDKLRARAASKSVELDGLVGETERVLCDRDRIVEVLAQLLRNAIDVSHPRSAVVVRAEPRDEDVLITVSDRGPGIDVSAWPYIFDGAWQARESGDHHEGLGLGLAVCKGVVKAHGGTIWVESRMGEGTTFLFTLPLAPGSSPAPAAH